MQQFSPKAHISLVGAGPGDPDLISVKGLKAIQSADAILYDALVNPILLKNAPSGCVKIYVGKRRGMHRYPQEKINELLVQTARRYGHAVRLKGGDAFVFGRGHEELTYVRAHKIPVSIVPGISSCISVPALQEIPLTCRGVNESFWVLTATTKNGKLSTDIQYAAQSSATAVILMGMRKLEEIVALFAHHGKTNCPAIVIEKGSCHGEKAIIGPLDRICESVRDAKLSAPGIIVIGEVVGLHTDWELAQKHPILIGAQAARQAFPQAIRHALPA
ncbi:MAG: uroporphyrinogen-III C-methyltransferase [Bacteroidota bacterium]